MADKELQTILNSGGINTIYLGGTASTNKAATIADITASIAAISSGTKAEQTLVADTPEILNWMTTTTLNVGSDFSISIPNDTVTIVNGGIFRFGGTINILADINDIVSITLYVNNLPTAFKSEVVGRGVGATTSIVYYGIAPLNASDDVSLWVESTSTAVTVDAASVVFEKVG